MALCEASNSRARHRAGRLVRERDWIGMIHYGVIFFMLEKLGAVTGVPNPAIYAAFKGMSLDDFQKTRNAAITYGVAGKDDD